MKLLVVRIKGSNRKTGKYFLFPLFVFLLLHFFIGLSSAGDISIFLTPSRVSGVAPLYVFFDATATTYSDPSINSFHDLNYRWSFGDDANSVWSTDGKNKNIATGPVAAHVFETPGTYTVELVVKDRNGDQSTAQVQIIVQNPDAIFVGNRTRCVSIVGDFSGCPNGAAQVISSDFRAQLTWVGQASSRRVLFRRGETWSASGGISLNREGPGLIGAYGTGNKPIINSAGSVFSLSGRPPVFQDWRIMDLELVGSGLGNGTAFGHEGTVKQLLIHRVDAHNFRSVLNIAYSVLDYNNTNGFPGHDRNDQIAISDSHFYHGVGGTGSNIAYFSSERMAILGSVWEDSTNIEHVLRTPHIGKGVISHNIMRDQAAGRHVLKLHGPSYTALGLGQGLYSEFIVLSDNEFKGSDFRGADWTVGIGPSDNHTDERVRNIIVERNMFRAGVGGTQVSLNLWGGEITARNNIFDTTGGFGHVAISITQRGIEPPPQHIRIYNNTFYNDDNISMVGVSIGVETLNTTVINNLVAAPHAPNSIIISGNTTSLIQNNNAVLTSAGFISATPANALDFQLQNTSPAVNVGATVPVFEDFVFTQRPQGGTFDLGAFELSSTPSEANFCSEIYQYGITWTFDQAHECGQFVNGDYWVVGPVTIISITPEYVSVSGQERHGWEVNPTSDRNQGFDSRAAGFNPGFVPSLPYFAFPGTSIVKTISNLVEPPRCTRNTNHTCNLVTAAVLTVLDQTPPNNGATVFRPPYFGTQKPLYSIHDLHPEFLPSVPAPTGITPPLLNNLKNRFQRVQLDHFTDWMGRSIHPDLNMPDYGGDIALNTGDAALRFFLNDSTEEKMPALINYLQMGIDLYAMMKNGTRWVANGGHDSGRKLPLILTSILFNNQTMKNDIRDVPKDNPNEVFQEDGMLYLSDPDNNGERDVLFGGLTSEICYWNNQVSDDCSRTARDPYRYIDPRIPGTSYQRDINSMIWKGPVVAMQLLPEIESIWNNNRFMAYVDRWVSFGAWSQPDPCAPADGVCVGGSNAGGYCNSAGSSGNLTSNSYCPQGSCELRMDNYRITFGPNPGHPGQCILDSNPADGIGRHPNRHGMDADQGLYDSPFVNRMWADYRNATPVNRAPQVNAGPDQSLTLPLNTVSLNGTVVDNDHLPNPPGQVSVQWSKVSGLGTVNFSNANLAVTSVDFSQSGVYVLKLTAHDGELSTFDEIQITVNELSSSDQSTISETKFLVSSDLTNSFHRKNPPISFQLKEPAYVRLEVLTLNGNLVTTLLDREESVGVKTIIWDGKNNSGESVSSGVYVVILKVGDQTYKSKVVILK